MCYLDAMSGPLLFLGGSVVLLTIALVILAIATVVLMFVRLERHLEEKWEQEKKQAQNEEKKENP